MFYLVQKLIMSMMTIHFCHTHVAFGAITNSQQVSNDDRTQTFGENSHPMLHNPSIPEKESMENITSLKFHGGIHGLSPSEINTNKPHEGNDTHHGIRLASWKWHEYWEHVLFCLIIVMAGVFKLAFHHTPILSNYLPESCVLILIGIISGCFIYYGINSEDYPFPKFTSHLFFTYLLPPIVLDSAYSLYDRDFLYNIGSIIVFAVIGTLFNVFAVGFGLYFINYISKYNGP